ncbi:MAG: hypothetical protein EBR30_23400 [Cytophagia bacterium]|jgi:hypothetical protein|nr:hypothetical protein [Cytophagia bacterium]
MWKQQINMANKMMKQALKDIDNIDLSSLSDEQKKFFITKVNEVKQNAKKVSFEMNANNDNVLKSNNKVIEDIINFTKSAK